MNVHTYTCVNIYTYTYIYIYIYKGMRSTPAASRPPLVRAAPPCSVLVPAS